MDKKLTPDYFIAKFSAIPDDKWTTDKFINDLGQCCVLGHLGMRSGYHQDKGNYEETQSLNYLFIDNLFTGTVTSVNDGKCALFQQPHPKQRILAALEYIKKTIAIKTK